MKISNIYQKFNVPPNLQEHMMRVCSLIALIEKHWIGEEVDWHLAKKAALLHDIGNIVKFDLDNHPEFLGEEQSRLDYWKEVQRQTVQKYGKDDNKATKKMLREMEIDEELIEIIWDKRFSNSVAIEDSNSWQLKIMYYADLRTLPLGIGTLEERIEDVRRRMPQYTNRPDFEDLVKACREIGRQIQEKVNIPLEQISDKDVRIDNQTLLETEVKKALTLSIRRSHGF